MAIPRKMHYDSGSSRHPDATVGAPQDDILNMLNILFIGDINGKIGRATVKKVLPKLKKELALDLVVANAENAAHGAGITETIIKELIATGIDYFTTGDHAFDAKQPEVFMKYPILRPANYSQEAPGQGCAIFNIKGYNILLINLIGQVFMSLNHDNPFHKLNEILANTALPGDKLSAIIIDIHAEATSEKVAIKYYADGRASAVLGTHTHIMTADPEITDKGTAYITDVGMVGAADGCLGVEKEGIIKTFLTQIKEPHVIPEKGRTIFNAIYLAIDPKTTKAKTIKPIIKYIDIK